MKSKAVLFGGNRTAEVRELEVRDPVYDEVQAKTLVNGVCMAEVWIYGLENPVDAFVRDYSMYRGRPENMAIAGHEGVGIVTKVGKTGGTIGLYGWIHADTTVNTTAWHTKGLKVTNVAPSITVNEKPLRNFERADLLMATGKIDQKKLITHEFDVEDIENAMGKNLNRKEGFIKSILKF